MSINRIPTGVRNHALSFAFGVIFLAALIAQSIVGHIDHNEIQVAHGMPEVSYWHFITSSSFAVDVAENWQSEYLQFFLFILGTIWFVQKGSPESKKPGDEGPQSDKDQLVGEYAQEDSPKWVRMGGWREKVFSNSLLLVMGAIFLLSWWAQSVTGVVAYNQDQAMHGDPAIGWLDYIASADFWNRTLQNWQSEFLAVGSMAALAIYLRQRGSAESKKVGAPHLDTADAGE
ncbi:DUF6766 family protein [Ruicaihuangia caeni]|uniref:DUF4328 domain-containing protein n=1 Tax=Ruicaihuangia caeni TaxID=3042517 RepID=A0AAW6T454_9MICO|nr:DUF6766 family protein [Klugiella sp. YN-L-19]MDI2097861.1 hypothetical protein [Klugiella sp. YN-L-19]